MDLATQRILITGGTRGIGLELARELQRRGAEVAVSGGTELTPARVADLYPGARYFRADLGSAEQVRSLVERVRSDFGPVTMLVNKAGVQLNHDWTETREQDRECWARMEATTNLVAPLSLTALLLDDAREVRALEARRPHRRGDRPGRRAGALLPHFRARGADREPGLVRAAHRDAGDDRRAWADAAPTAQRGARPCGVRGGRGRVRPRSGRLRSLALRVGGLRAHAPPHGPMAGLDELLLDQARMGELQDRPGIAAAVERIVRRDLGRTWPLDRVAKELAMSRRTLQRRLSDAGRTFSDLVLEIRTGEASRLLRDTELSVTAIGYPCGFADTSHFSHTFKNRYGATPGAWKAVAKGES